MKKATVQVHQSLMDIAIQYCGSAEAVFALAVLNGLSITDDLVAGQVLLLPIEYNVAIAQIFAQENYYPAVNILPSQDGIDYDTIEIDLEVL